MAATGKQKETLKSLAAGQDPNEIDKSDFWENVLKGLGLGAFHAYHFSPDDPELLRRAGFRRLRRLRCIL